MNLPEDLCLSVQSSTSLLPERRIPFSYVEKKTQETQTTSEKS